MIIRFCIFFLLIFYPANGGTSGEHRKWRQSRSPRRKSLHELLTQSRNVASMPDEGRSLQDAPRSAMAPLVQLIDPVNFSASEMITTSQQLKHSPRKVTRIAPHITRDRSSAAAIPVVGHAVEFDGEIGDSVAGYNGPNSFAPSPSYADPSFLSAVMDQAERANFRYPRRKPKPEVPAPTQINRKSNVNEISPADESKSELKGLSKISIHQQANESVTDNPSNPKEYIPQISGGYASIDVTDKMKSSKDKARRKPIYRPARRKVLRAKAQPTFVKSNFQVPSTDKGRTNKRVIKRPKFPKRLPPVRTSNIPVKTRIQRPVNVRISRPTFVLKNSISSPEIKKNETQLESKIKPETNSKFESSQATTTPTVMKTTSLEEETPEKNIITDRKDSYKSSVNTNIGYKGNSPNINIHPKEKTRENNRIKVPLLRSVPSRIYKNENKLFSPSKIDPFYNKPKLPPFIHSQPKTNIKPNYYNPLVLPPVVNSYGTPPTQRRIDKGNLYNAGQYSAAPEYNSDQPSLAVPERFSPPRISDRQRLSHHHPPPKSYYSGPLVPPPHNRRRNTYHAPPTFTHVRRPPPRNGPRFKRRRPVKNKQSFFDRIFSKRKGEIDHHPNYVRRNGITYKKAKAPHVDYILSNGPKPKHGRKIMVVGPFKHPPIGAPNFPSSAERMQQSATGPTAISTKYPKLKGWSTHLASPRHSLRQSHQTYQGRYNKKKTYKKQRTDVDKSWPVSSASYVSNNINYNALPTHLQEVTDEDKERIIAAKLYFPKATSIRRSGIERNVIPLPVPALQANGKQIFNVKNFILPSLPNMPASRMRGTPKHYLPKPSQSWEEQLAASKLNMKQKYPSQYADWKPPISYTKSVTSSVNYDGWKVVTGKKDAEPKLNSTFKSPRLSDSAVLPKLNNVLYTPKNTSLRNSVNEEIIMGTQPQNKKMVRYSSTLNVDAPKVIKSVLIHNPHTL